MPTKLLQNVLTGAGTVLVFDPGPVPTVTEARKNVKSRRLALRKRYRIVSLKRSKQATPPAKGEAYVEKVAQQTLEGVEKLIDEHPKRDLIRDKTGRLRLFVFSLKRPVLVTGTPG